MENLQEGVLELMRNELRSLMHKVSRIDLGTTYRILKDLVGVGDERLVAEAITSLVDAHEIAFESRRTGSRHLWVGIVRR